ncbi:MAG TPA: fatty acid desaturase [Polyangiaceae bacterium]|jgi:fatty acid desaturase
MDLVLSDPTYRAPATESPVERTAERFIHDRRDVPFLSLMATLTLTVVPTGVLLFVPGQFRWWLAAVHLVLVVYFLGPFVLMLHNTSHRRLFKRPWQWMNNYIPWVLGPFFGESPETYFAHHVGMHHPENNLEADLSSTMGYQRDSILGFVHYFLTFFFLVLGQLAAYLRRKGRRSLMIRCILGEFLFYGAMAALCVYDWRPTVCVFVAPFIVTRFAMMAGNWAQHAFVDAGAPENCYRNSITCINSSYNRRCFNDGYHIGHHIKQTRHWTEMPEDFRRNLATYAEEKALVFEGVDFFVVWLWLMLGRYDWLARRYVHLGAARMSETEIIGLLRTRTARIG